MPNPIKIFLKTFLKKTNHELYNRIFTDYHLNIESSLIRLKDLGFKPNLIFDVGAYSGDFAKFCDELWNDSEIVCFEVQTHKITELKKIEESNSRIKIVPKLLGSIVSEKMPFYQLTPDSETASSILKTTTISSNIPVQYFPATTIDNVITEELSGKTPDLLKIDVQGYELEVLKGAKENLKNIRIILVEVNLLELYCDVPLVTEVMNWLSVEGWVLYDICSLMRRPLDSALFQSDFIFVKNNDPLRADRRFDEHQKLAM